MTKSIFKGTEESPYHFSVGAVLYDEKKQVACHYFKELASYDKAYKDFYILMRETVEAGEGLEEAVLRGIMEEFGSTGKIERFIGTLVTKFPREDVWVEKTTSYFLVKLENFDVSKRVLDDMEKVSIVQWHPIDFLISKMEEQGQKYERTDLDESEILKRVKKYLS